MTNAQTKMPCRSIVADFSDVRCDCNALLAKIENGKLALKCKRCKRIVTLPMKTNGDWSEVRFEE